MPLVFGPGQHILFIGDSITDAGRNRAKAESMGNGYAAIVAGALLAARPDLRLRFTNTGIGGDTIRNLAARWDRDAVSLAPDWLSISIGINDVWRLISPNPESRAQAVPLDEYKRIYRELLDRARRGTRTRFILMEPGIIDQDISGEPNRKLEGYAEAVGAFAREYDAVLVPVRSAFKRALAALPDYAWTTDGTHPTTQGHFLMAAAWLAATGMPVLAQGTAGSAIAPQ